jgi:hypothetical protein
MAILLLLTNPYGSAGIVKRIDELGAVDEPDDAGNMRTVLLPPRNDLRSSPRSELGMETLGREG